MAWLYILIPLALLVLVGVVYDVRARRRGRSIKIAGHDSAQRAHASQPGFNPTGQGSANSGGMGFNS